MELDNCGGDPKAYNNFKSSQPFYCIPSRTKVHRTILILN